MSFFVFNSKKTEHLIGLLDYFNNVLIMHYPGDTKNINYTFNSHIKPKLSTKYLPTTWSDFNKYASCCKISFTNIDKFPVVYLHNFEYPGVKEWRFIQDKLYGKIVIMTYDELCEFTPYFIEDGLQSGEFAEIDYNDLGSNRMKRLRLQHLIKENKLPF